MKLEDVLRAIDAEPEYDGPDTAAFIAEQDAKGRGDDARRFIDAVRIAVRDTKAGIRSRILAMASPGVNLPPGFVGQIPPPASGRYDAYGLDTPPHHA